MVKDKQTALQIDIARRKRLFDKLDKERRNLKNKREEAKTKTQKDREIFLGYYCLELFKDIQKSEKLLPMDREQTIQFAVNNCLEIGDSIDFRHTAEFLYNEKYGSDE